MIREWDLTETNLGRAAKRKYEVAVLPIGAVEPHNHHLPYGTDFRQVTYIARTSCEAAWEQAPSVLCLPTLPYGVDCNLMDFPLAMHVSQAALDGIVRELVTSLRTHGIRKIVLLNGHGGNDFWPMIRQVQCDLDVFLFIIDWWTVGLDRYDEFFDKPDDHAGQFETSTSLAIQPELVELDTARDGKVRPFRFEAIEKGWVRVSRRFADLNDHCAVGDPTGATAERGKAYLDLVCGRVGTFLAELAQSPIDAHFPQVP